MSNVLIGIIEGFLSIAETLIKHTERLPDSEEKEEALHELQNAALHLQNALIAAAAQGDSSWECN